MKKALIGTALATGILLSAQNTLADTGYIGINYQMYTLSASGQDDLKPQGVALKIGGSLNQYFQMEARLGTGTTNDNNASQSITITNTQGFYLKGGMDVMNMVYPYVIAGFTKYDIQKYGYSNADTESGTSFGVGADFHYKHMQVGLEWMRLDDKSRYNLDQLSVSAAWRF